MSEHIRCPEIPENYSYRFQMMDEQRRLWEAQRICPLCSKRHDESGRFLSRCTDIDAQQCTHGFDKCAICESAPWAIRLRAKRVLPEESGKIKMTKKILTTVFLAITLLLAVVLLSVAASAQSNPPLTIRDTDGSHSQTNASVLVFQNGSVSISNGVVTISGGNEGTVTSVSVVTANGVSGSVATSTTTPAITLTLGAIVPTTVNGLTVTTTTGTLTIPDGVTLNAGAGGTLGSNAFNSTAYLPLAGGTLTGGVGFSVTNTLDIGTSATVLAPRTVYAGTSFVGPLGTFTTGVQVANGAVGTPSYSFSGDTNTGFYWANADQIEATLGGVRSFTFSSPSGRREFGIGGGTVSGIALLDSGFVNAAKITWVAANSIQLGDISSSGAASAQTFSVQGSSGNSAAAALFTIAGSDQSGTTTTGGGLKIRGGNGTSAGGAVEIWTSATTTPAVAVSVAADKSVTLTGALDVNSSALIVNSVGAYSPVVSTENFYEAYNTTAAAKARTVSLRNLSIGTNGAVSGLSMASTMFISWASVGLGGGDVVNTRDAHLSRNAAGILQFGTTAANAAGSWLATNGTLSGFLVIGAGTSIAKHLSAAATLDFASLVAAGCEDLTITVTGAAVGDTVGIGVPNASVVANGAFSAWVSATDTVTVRFCTVISGDPASGSFRADVWVH